MAIYAIAGKSHKLIVLEVGLVQEEYCTGNLVSRKQAHIVLTIREENNTRPHDPKIECYSSEITQEQGK